MSEQISQIKFDKNFVEKLLAKLKIGNKRSIHLNAIPGRLALRLDLFHLSKIDRKTPPLFVEIEDEKIKNTPEKFIENILHNESFSFPISYDNISLGELSEDEKGELALLSKRLNKIVIENDDNFLEFGIKNFGFGYPFLIKRDRNDPTKIIKAPLFIWHLDIERSYQNKNKWTIKKEEDFPIKLNELLVSHIAKDETIQLEKIPEKILEDGILNEGDLLDLCDKILSKLGTESETLTLKIEKCPDNNRIESIANDKAWIQWSGVFGIYRSQKETIIHATEELSEGIEKFESEDLILDKFQTSTVSAIETDPNQEEIINTLTKDEIKLIQGPPGTGKSQSITAIVANALANKAKCLIVCEKKTALDVIQANLDKMKLGGFSIVIDDVNKDRKKVIEKARDIKENSYHNPFSQHSFDDKYKKFCDLKKELNNNYSAPLKKVFGDFSWKQLIGLYLRFSKSVNFQYVLEKLNIGFLKFIPEEYFEYLGTTKEASSLYKEMKKDSEGVFSELCLELFTEEYKWAVHEKVKNETNNLLEIVKSFNASLSDKNRQNCEEKLVSLFKPDSITKSKNLIGVTIADLKELQTSYKKGHELAGEKFNEKGFWRSVSFSVLSIFNTKYKRMNKIRKKMYKLMNSVIEKVTQVEEMGFENLKIRKFKETKTWIAINDDCTNTLNKIKKIKSKILDIEKLQKTMQKVENKLQPLTLNKIFDFTIKNHIELGNFESISNHYSNFEEKIKKIETFLDVYESFHNWKFFALRRNKHENKILSVLKNIPTEEWENIFKAWYYRGALFNYEGKSKIRFNKSDTKLQQLSSLYTDLKKQQLNQIKYIWGNKRDAEFPSLRDNFNILYNLRSNKIFRSRNSLRKIILHNFNLFTTLFPVVLTNPNTVNAIFPLKQGLFEIVIFDEASQLRIEDTFTSLIRGQYKIIVGDKHQMPPSNYFRSPSDTVYIEDKENDDDYTEDDEQTTLAESESLLQYAEDLKIINKSYLDFHYRSKHPALINFSNYAFYGGNLVPFPAQEPYKPIEFRNVNGTYNSGTNPEERTEVVKILKKEIHQDQKGKYPSIGIATFNIHQRNLIIEALNVAVREDASFAQKLQELREKGLFVKNLENIQGDERDIIILSTTYGIRSDGKFYQRFARLNTNEGYKLLNVLVTRAKKKVYVCTSIPKEKYLSYSELIKNEKNNKKGILYAYLSYAEAISNRDDAVVKDILMTLKKQTFETPRPISQNDELSESPFEEEVYVELLEHFEKKQIIQQYKIGGFRLDFVINIGTTRIVLECDGKTYHQSDEACAYDMYREKELKNMGFKVYRIWSTRWFEDKDREMKKFLNYVECMENKKV